MALNFQTGTAGMDDPPPPLAPLPPEALAPHFPQLEIQACLGRGGMGVVYRVRQKSLNRLAALKVLAPERVADPNFAQRFAREAQALASLNHPHIVTIYDFGQAGGFFYLLMEFVDGTNLRQVLRSRKLAPPEALSIVPSLCDALQYAHDRGIVHRDIKPENLLLDQQGRVKIADFGIAKMLASRPGEEASSKIPSPPAGPTRQGLGTPGYSAPEQVADPGSVDHRADIFSMGVVIYEMLTGEMPGRPLLPPSQKVRVDVRLDEIVLHALEVQPQLRYQQASLLKTQIESVSLSNQGSRFRAGVPLAYAGYEYRSSTTLFGWPLVHVATGLDPRTGQRRIARGIIAIGDVAVGGVAMGGAAFGVFAMGGGAVGVVAFGGGACGLLAAGGLAVGLLAAFGGLALAPIALGGQAIGYLACGGQGIGAHVLDAARQDPVAVKFFKLPLPLLMKYGQAIFGVVLALSLPISIVVPLWLLSRQRARIGAKKAG